MSKARERYLQWKNETNWLPLSITNYVTELERENNTLKLEQGQCLLCTAGHKEEVYELKKQKRELVEVLKECYKRFKQYEMDVDEDRPRHHVNFMQVIEKLLAHHTAEEEGE